MQAYKMGSLLLIVLTICLKFHISYTLRTCAYFPGYPSLTNISYANCSYESQCSSNYTTTARDACVTVTSGIWWICFIVIIAVALLAVAVTIICCLVKTKKEADQHSLFKKQNYYSQNDDTMIIQPAEYQEEIDDQPKFAIKYTSPADNDKTEEDMFDFNQTPNYISLFEKQGATIDLEVQDETGVSKPTLPATYIIDKEALNKPVDEIIPKNEIVATRNLRVGALSPINTSLSLN